MASVVIIGAGGVGRVVAHKCAQMESTFDEICLASRTRDRCEEIASRLSRPIQTAEVDADDTGQVIDLLKEVQPDMVIHVALPYQDLTIMDACLEQGVHYLDTANYEPPDHARMEYHWQWAYRERFERAGIMALLGCGFDPGVTGVFVAHALKHHFDGIHEIDIVDCNAGENGLPFATNFNPEINIREVTAPARHFSQGEWVESPALSTKCRFDFPGVGPRDAYLMYHEELESLAVNIPGVRRLRFWMTFSESYLRHLEVLENVGMTRIDPVLYQGREIIPLQFLKEVLPSPADLGARTRGKTSIGCCLRGEKDGKDRTVFVHNQCDHEVAFEEVGSQAVSYTTGVPAAIGAALMMDGIWRKPGVYNVEEFDPDPFLERMGPYGLPWTEEVDQGGFEERCG